MVSLEVRLLLAELVPTFIRCIDYSIIAAVDSPIVMTILYLLLLNRVMTKLR